MILTDHKPSWRSAFLDLRRVYEEVLGDFVVAIEHVGSTAIEGIAAKPILDIDVLIKKASIFPHVREKLESIGYRNVGDLGVPEREAFSTLLGERTSERLETPASAVVPALGRSMKTALLSDIHGNAVI